MTTPDEFIRELNDDTGFLILGWKRKDSVETCIAVFPETKLTPDERKADLKIVIAKMVDELPNCRELDSHDEPKLVGKILIDHERKDGS